MRTASLRPMDLAGSHVHHLCGPAGGWPALATWPRGEHAQTAQPETASCLTLLLVGRHRPGGNPVRTAGQRACVALSRAQDSPPPLPCVLQMPAESGGTTHRPGGRLGCAGLLEGDVEVVGAGVVGVGGDDGRRRHGVEGGARLCIWRVGGHAGRVLWGVGAGRGRPAAHLVHGTAQQIELGLAGSGRREGETHSQAGEWKPGPSRQGGVLLQEP